MGIVTALSDTNYGRMPLSEYSLTFGEALSKVGRHRLCLLCLTSIEKDLQPSSNLDEGKGRGRGRPQSPATVLANRVGVTYDSVKRWADLSKIQSCDANAVKLAEVAYGYDAPATVRILEEDLELHRTAIEGWVRRVDHQNNSSKLDEFQPGGKLPPGPKTLNITAGACVENAEVEEGS